MTLPSHTPWFKRILRRVHRRQALLKAKKKLLEAQKIAYMHDPCGLANLIVDAIKRIESLVNEAD